MNTTFKIDLTGYNNRIKDGNYNFCIKNIKQEVSQKGNTYFLTELTTVIDKFSKTIFVNLFEKSVGELYCIIEFGFVKQQEIEVDLNSLIGKEFNANLRTKNNTYNGKVYETYTISNFRQIDTSTEPTEEDDIPF